MIAEASTVQGKQPRPSSLPPPPPPAGRQMQFELGGRPAMQLPICVTLGAPERHERNSMQIRTCLYRQCTRCNVIAVPRRLAAAAATGGPTLPLLQGILVPAVVAVAVVPWPTGMLPLTGTAPCPGTVPLGVVVVAAGGASAANPACIGAGRESEPCTI